VKTATITDATYNAELLIEQDDLQALGNDILTAINKTLPAAQAFKSAIAAIECFEMEDCLASNHALQEGIEKLIYEWPGMSADQANQYVQMHTTWPLNIELENKALEKIYEMIREYRTKERHLKIKTRIVQEQGEKTNANNTENKTDQNGNNLPESV